MRLESFTGGRNSSMCQFLASIRRSKLNLNRNRNLNLNLNSNLNRNLIERSQIQLKFIQTQKKKLISIKENNQ